jgi:hypothetical protein
MNPVIPDVLDAKSIKNLYQIIGQYLASSANPIKIKCATTTVTTPSGKVTVAHNLGVVPNLYSISSETWAGGGNTNSLYIDPANLPDKTNFYLLNPSGINVSITLSYVAAYIPNNG